MILGKNSIQENCYIIHWTKYIIKHYLMKCTMIFMCKYSNEMMTSIKAIEFKYFTIGLECGEENVLIVFHFHKCELKENKQRHDDIILLQR